MREHKYKVWDKVAKQMYQVNAIDFKNKQFLEVETLDTKSVITLPEGTFDENFVLLEFTGLHDCKQTKEYPEGQEIYDGDICKVTNVGIIDSEDPNPYLRVIKWDENRGGFYHFRVDGKEGGSGWSFINSTVGKYYEVIGNIHSRPELLEENNDV